MLTMGYCRPHHALPGTPIALHAAGRGPVDIEVACDSLPSDVVWRATGIPTSEYGTPADVVADGCGWPQTCTVPTGADWPSGCYLVRMRPSGAPSADPATAFFVLRAERPTAAAVVVLATNTWNAYNDFGGANLYTGATAVSFERPLAPGMLERPDGPGARLTDGARRYMEYTAAHGLGMWNGMAGWAGQERRFAHWAAANEIAVDFATNGDLEHDPSWLDGYRLFLSVGHDEYWSAPMRDAVEGFVARGGAAAFLSGNTCYWQVRVEGPRLTCFKHRFTEDPRHGTDDARVTTMWSDPLLARPENAMTGVSFTRGGYHRIHRSVPHGTGGYEVHRPTHWLLDGTGLQRGDQLGAAAGAVGYECDGCDMELRDGLPVPTGHDGTPAEFEIVATAPATPFDRASTPLPLAPGGEYELEFHARRLLGDASPAACDRLRAGHAVLGAFEREGTVVTTGCTDWAYALDDPAVAQVTRNIIRRATAEPA
jgi:hypothetical protein